MKSTLFLLIVLNGACSGAAGALDPAAALPSERPQTRQLHLDSEGLTNVFVEELQKELHEQMLAHQTKSDDSIDYEGFIHKIRSGLFNVNDRLKDYEPAMVDEAEEENCKSKRPLSKAQARRKAAIADFLNGYNKANKLYERCKLARRFKAFKKGHESPGLDALLAACKAHKKGSINKLYDAWYNGLPTHRTRKTCKNGKPLKRDYQFQKHKFNKKNRFHWKSILKLGVNSLCSTKHPQDKKTKKLCAQSKAGLLEDHDLVDKHSVRAEATLFKQIEKDISKKVAAKGIPTSPGSNSMTNFACRDFLKLDADSKRELKAEQKAGKSKMGLRGYKYLRCACSKTKNRGCAKQAAKFTTELLNDLGRVTRKQIKKDLKKYYTKQCKANAFGRKGQHGLVQIGDRNAKSKVGYEEKPDGTREISIPISAVLTCAISWNPRFTPTEVSASCTLFQIITATISVKPVQSQVTVEVGLCAPGVSDVLSLLEKIPGVESFLNNNGIYGGCYRLGHGAYDWKYQNLFIRQDSLCLNVWPFRGCVPAGIYFRFKTSAPYDHDGEFKSRDLASGRCDKSSQCTVKHRHETYCCQRHWLGWCQRDCTRSIAYNECLDTINNCKPWVNFWINVKLDMYQVWLFGAGWNTLVSKDILNKFFGI